MHTGEKEFRSVFQEPCVFLIPDVQLGGSSRLCHVFPSTQHLGPNGRLLFMVPSC
jgi:hypothetical protein